jgi:hypothetical protein
MKGKKQQQEQVTISAYQMEVIQQSFTSTLKWLEHYIDKSGYSSNWKRQISETVTRRDLDDKPEEIRGFMETSLLGLNGVIENKPNFVFENLQEKFYSWLAESGIGIDDCPEGLIESLVDIHKVLNNEGKEFAERVSEEAGENIAKMTPEERRKNFYRTFTVAQRLMDTASARQKSLEGKTYKDVDTKNQFSGNSEQGKKLLGQIENKHSANFGGANLEKVVENLKADPKNYWRLDEIPTEIDDFHRVKKQEWLLIRWDARENDFNPDGKLNFNNNPLYRWESFSVRQRFEVKIALGIAVNYLTEEEIKWVFREFKENPRAWRIEVIKGQNYLVHNSAQGDDREVGTLIHNQQKFSKTEWEEVDGTLKGISTANQSIRWELVNKINQQKNRFKVEKVVNFNREINDFEEEIWIIHDLAERKDNGMGGLVFDSENMVKVKDLTEAEKQAIAYSESEQRLKYSSFAPTQKGDSKITFGIAGVISALLITSVILVKKAVEWWK